MGVMVPISCSHSLVPVFCDVQYSTADFPQKGIGAYKLISSDPSTLEFSGRPDAKTGAKVTSPDLFLDSRDGHIIVAHAIDHVLFPSRFF